MAGPAASYLQLIERGRSHIPPHELETRRKAEESMLTKTLLVEFDEVKKNKVAHKEFLRISEMLSKIQKNDAIYAGAINRYCLLAAECKDIEKQIKKYKKMALDAKKKYKNKEIDYDSYTNVLNLSDSKAIQFDKQLQSKRMMMFNIEKENLMTISSSLRCVPKKQTKKEKEDNDLFD